MGSFTPSPAGGYEQHLAEHIQLGAVHPVLSSGNLNSCSMFAQKTEDFCHGVLAVRKRSLQRGDSVPAQHLAEELRLPGLQSCTGSSSSWLRRRPLVITRRYYQVWLDKYCRINVKWRCLPSGSGLRRKECHMVGQNKCYK